MRMRPRLRVIRGSRNRPSRPSRRRRRPLVTWSFAAISGAFRASARHVRRTLPARLAQRASSTSDRDRAPPSTRGTPNSRCRWRPPCRRSCWTSAASSCCGGGSTAARSTRRESCSRRPCSAAKAGSSGGRASTRGACASPARLISSNEMARARRGRRRWPRAVRPRCCEPVASCTTTPSSRLMSAANQSGRASSRTGRRQVTEGMGQHSARTKQG